MGVGLHVFGQVIVATVANFEVSFAGSTIGEVWTFTASMAPLQHYHLCLAVLPASTK
jgi:hypothetical protein